MQIKTAEQVEAREVTMDGASKVTMRMLIGPDDNAPTFNMRMFELAPGGHTPRHAHDWEHEVYILSGEGAVYADGEETPVLPGQCLFVPPGEAHQFVNTGDGPMRFLCLVPKD
jgi:quercetin dioxygenase-like cupin family protein